MVSRRFISRPVEKWTRIFFTLMLFLIFCTPLGAPHTARAATDSPEILVTPRAASVGINFLHFSGSGTIDGNKTYLNNSPAIESYASAILIVTQVFQPSWGKSTAPVEINANYNDHPIGVYYNHTAQEWAVINEDLAVMPEMAGFNVLVVNNYPGAFTWTAVSGSLNEDYTLIDDSRTNGHPELRLLVTQNYEPNLVYNPHHIGVWYNSVAEKWAVFNQDGTSIPVNASFNIFIIPNQGFTATADASNRYNNFFYIHHRLTDYQPDAFVHATPVYGSTGVYVDRATGVWYDTMFSGNAWTVFDMDDYGSIPEGAQFFVWAPADVDVVHVHEATAANLLDFETVVDQPQINATANNIVMITPRYSVVPGAPGVFNNHPTGVAYEPNLGKLGIFNEDFVTMPVGAFFNVFAPNIDHRSFVHMTKPDTIFSNYSLIDTPLLNNNPNMIIFVTPSSRPYGIDFPNVPENLGVWYSHVTDQWSIYYQDLTTMQDYIAFNVWVPDARWQPFVHVSTVGNIVDNCTYIDRPRLNRNPAAALLVTPNWNPGGVGGAYYDEVFGVWYDNSFKKWCIYNVDLTEFPAGRAFNVVDVSYHTYLPVVKR